MDKEFRIKKYYACFFAVITGLSIVYSVLISPYQTPILTEDEKTLKHDIRFVSSRLKHSTNYWVEFDFYGDQKSFKMSQLKYLHYKRLKSDLKPYDNLKITYDDEYNIFSIYLKGKNYIETKELIESNKANRKFWLFFRTIIFIALLPIFFFKKQPKFWHSGFEFEFKFSYLLFIILGFSILVYFYLYGYDYILSFDIKDLK